MYLLSVYSPVYLISQQHADNAQQAFSSERASTLNMAIPALEALHRAWSSQASRPKYIQFVTVLETASNKIEEYYNKTTESPAYVMVMSTLSPFFSYYS